MFTTFGAHCTSELIFIFQRNRFSCMSQHIALAYKPFKKSLDYGGINSYLTQLLARCVPKRPIYIASKQYCIESILSQYLHKKKIVEHVKKCLGFKEQGWNQQTDSFVGYNQNAMQVMPTRHGTAGIRQTAERQQINLSKTKQVYCLGQVKHGR